MHVKKTLAFVLAFVFALAMAVPALGASTVADNKIDVPSGYTQLVDWSRLAGEGRHDTMQAISQDGFESADTVIVAGSANFPDALSATSLAGYYDSPILLTTADTLAKQCSDEIERLGATKVIVVGGASSVSDSAFAQIEEIVGEGNVERISGLNRFETSLKIYDAGKTLNIWSKTAIVVSGMNFADALSMSPWAYAQKSPIFLADSEGALSADTIQAITEGGFTNIVIASGTKMVSTATEAQLKGIVGVANVERLAGANRYETSGQVVAWAVEHGLSYTGAAVASGASFPDALSGGALCGYRGSVLILACDDDYDGAYNAMHENRATVENANVLGGPASISDTVYAELQEATLEKAYTVTFNANGGTFSDSTTATTQSILDGGYATAPTPEPTYTAYEFDGWYTSTDGGTTLSDTAYDFENTAVTGDITLYAKWIEAKTTSDYFLAKGGLDNTTLTKLADGTATETEKIANSFKSEADVKADIKKLEAGDTTTTTTWAVYMNSDSGTGDIDTIHLYTKWNGVDATTDVDKWVEFRIVQVGEHDSDGSNVTFMAVHSLPTAQAMNSTDTNAGEAQLCMTS